MVDENRCCMDIANQLLACEAVLRAHLEGCVMAAGALGLPLQTLPRDFTLDPMWALRREKHPGRKAKNHVPA